MDVGKDLKTFFIVTGQFYDQSVLYVIIVTSDKGKNSCRRVKNGQDLLLTYQSISHF